MREVHGAASDPGNLISIRDRGRFGGEKFFLFGRNGGPQVVRGARACEFLNIVSGDREDGRTDRPQVGNVGWVRPFGRRMQTKFIWCEREYDYHFLRWKGRKVRFGKQVPDKSVSVCTRRLEGGLSAV